MRLKGKSAIITGCTQGIGRAIAVMFAKEGASLIRNDIKEEIANLEEELRKIGVDVLSVAGDITDLTIVQKIVDKAIENYGKIDILVNTVALPHRKTIMETSFEEFDKIINTNLKAVFYPTKIVIPHMIKRR